jgi:hypothetical protein
MARPKLREGPLLVLGAPRSFTSVVGAMLGCHPQMYGLPETHLFQCETLEEWWRGIPEATWSMSHGVLRAVAELYFGGQTEATVRRARGWLRRRLHLSTGILLEALAERIAPRLLVDKSPNTVWSMDYLRRAHALFPQARFVHLTRHPRAHGESVLKYLAHKAKEWETEQGGPLPPNHWLVTLCTFPPPPGITPEPAAPAGTLDPQWGWYALNRNITDFLEGVPAAQVYRVRGEDILTDPDSALPPLAEWLGLRDDPEVVEEMKHPERSPYAFFGPPGAQLGNDFFFLQSPALRPGRAEPVSLEGPLSWRPDGAGFAPEVRQLAQEFGYS